MRRIYFYHFVFAACDLAQDTTLDKTCLLTVQDVYIFIVHNSQNILLEYYSNFFTIFYISVINSFLHWEITKVPLLALVNASDLFEIKEA